MRNWKLSILLLIAVLLCGCGKTEKIENPYRIKTQIWESYQQDKTQTVRTEYIYDENGWLVETQTYHNEEWWYTTKFILDEHGNSHGSEKVAANGDIITEVMLTTDEQGRMLTSEGYVNGELQETTEYGYNDDNQITKRYTTKLDTMNLFGGENRTTYIDSTYGKDGKLIREDILYTPNNESEYNLYIYENDLLVREENYAGDRMNFYTEYTFDDTGLIQTALTKKGTNYIHTKHITTFDEFGNPLEVLAFAYGSEFARLGKAEEEPDSRTVNIYEPKEGTS